MLKSDSGRASAPETETGPKEGKPAGERKPPADELDLDLSGLDALELHRAPPVTRLERLYRNVWPRVAALALAVGIWQLVVWTGWRPDYVLPPPGPVLSQLWEDLKGPELAQALAVTMSRAGAGFFLAVAIGTAIGVAVAKSRVLRSAIGSLITGLQTMPSIAWFPLAILLFRLGEGAILFVVVLGAAPAVANGVLSGIDHIPPVLERAGRVMGARGLTALRYVTFPAAFPNYVAGLKQGWAFAWRSLMAGELLAVAGDGTSIGERLNNARDLGAEELLATMVVILAIGIAVDALVFGTLERHIRRKRGLGLEIH